MEEWIKAKYVGKKFAASAPPASLTPGTAVATVAATPPASLCPCHHPPAAAPSSPTPSAAALITPALECQQQLELEQQLVQQLA
jgi:hypothetical protein